MAGQRANGRNPAYESFKAAQIALGRAIARAGEEKGIRCNVIAPGFIDSSMGRDASRKRTDRAVTVPFGRQGTGRQVAHAALFLISNESSCAKAIRYSSMPATWRASCGPSLHVPNGSGDCVSSRNAQLSRIAALFRNPT